jgi:hypothetical protein
MVYALAQRTRLISFWVGFLALFRGFSQIMLAFSIRHAGEEAAAIDPGRPPLTRPTCRGGAGVTGGCQLPPAAAAQMPARGVPTTRPRSVDLARPGASRLTKPNQTGGVGKMVTAANVSAGSPAPAAAPWPSTATPMLAIGQDARRDG